MSETKRIAPDQLTTYFDAFSKRFLMGDARETADVELLSSDAGDQPVASKVRLLGVDYDPHTNALELELATGDHRAFNPREVWAVEDADGFISSLQIVRDDGAREVVNISRGA
ncbi:MAG TPA: DUF5335 family protein [Gemmatimonadaceae bacterium]|jgi:hypothetical protein|nr:DUF5335 family protein [Gemmatimonadaceae bacterium]